MPDNSVMTSWDTDLRGTGGWRGWLADGRQLSAYPATPVARRPWGADPPGLTPSL